MEAKLLSEFFGKPFSEQLLQSIPAEARNALMAHAKTYADLSGSAKEKVPTSSFLVKLLERFELNVGSDLINRIQPHDEFEIWTLDGKFLASSNGFFSLTSWTLDDLLLRDRAELFTRDEWSMAQVRRSLNKVTTQKEIVERPCAPHVVRELKDDPESVYVDMKLFAPVFTANRDMVGVIAVIHFTPILN